MKISNIINVGFIGMSLFTQKDQHKLCGQPQKVTKIEHDNTTVNYDGYFFDGQFKSGTRTFVDSEGSELKHESGAFNNNLVEGEKVFKSGKREDGQFKNNELDGHGTRIESFEEKSGNFSDGNIKDGIRTLSDGTKFIGVFEENNLISGRIDSPDFSDNGVQYIEGDVERIPVSKTHKYREVDYYQLSGNGTKYFSNQDYQRGKFENNRFIEGEMRIAGKLYELHKESTGKVLQDYNSHSYYLNGQKVIEGTHLGSKKCLKSMNDYNTPFLFNPIQAKDAAVLFQDDQQLIGQMMEQFKINLESNKEVGASLLFEIFNNDIKKFDFSFILYTLLNHMPKYNYDQNMAIIFKVVDVLHEVFEINDELIKGVCEGLIPMLKRSMTVFNGLRTMSRVEMSPINQINREDVYWWNYELLLKAALFHSFGTVLGQNHKFSNIDCSFRLIETSGDFQNGYGGLFVTTNIDQFNSIWRAQIDSNSQPPKPSDTEQMDLEALNGIAFRIPNAMIQAFRKRTPWEMKYIGDTIHFRVPNNLSEDKQSALNEWEQCVLETLKVADLKNQNLN